MGESCVCVCASLHLFPIAHFFSLVDQGGGNSLWRRLYSSSYYYYKQDVDAYRVASSHTIHKNNWTERTKKCAATKTKARSGFILSNLKLCFGISRGIGCLVILSLPILLTITASRFPPSLKNKRERKKSLWSDVKFRDFKASKIRFRASQNSLIKGFWGFESLKLWKDRSGVVSWANSQLSCLRGSKLSKQRDWTRQILTHTHTQKRKLRLSVKTRRKPYPTEMLRGKAIAPEQ